MPGMRHPGPRAPRTLHPGITYSMGRMRARGLNAIAMRDSALKIAEAEKKRNKALKKAGIAVAATGVGVAAIYGILKHVLK